MNRSLDCTLQWSQPSVLCLMMHNMWDTNMLTSEHFEQISSHFTPVYHKTSDVSITVNWMSKQKVKPVTYERAGYNKTVLFFIL